MGIKDMLKPAYTDEDIVSVVILETTQMYKEKANWGMTFGPGNDDVIAMGGQQIPDGSVITFSVTYKDGEKRIVKARTGTAKCDRLLQLAMTPPEPPAGETEPDTDPVRKDRYEPIELKKNQIPQGEYLAGQDIPLGTFDFTWVWGDGRLIVYKTKEDVSSFGSWKLYVDMGKGEYQYRQCLNTHLEEGNVLVVDGTLIVQISRSKEVVIDI